MQQRAAGVHHVRHITFALRFVRTQQRFAQAANDFGGVVEIQQDCQELLDTGLYRKWFEPQFRPRLPLEFSHAVVGFLDSKFGRRAGVRVVSTN